VAQQIQQIAALKISAHTNESPNIKPMFVSFILCSSLTIPWLFIHVFPNVLGLNQAAPSAK
ncbi:MAG: hypothetical protein WCO28_08855, partial [Bacteroidota bacterium]